MTNNKKRRRKSPLTDANKPVLGALRVRFPDNKIWIGRGDRIEVDRKKLEGHKATPAEGVSESEHIEVLASAIMRLLSSATEADAIFSAIEDEDDYEYEEVDEAPEGTNFTDIMLFKRVEQFNFPNGFIHTLAGTMRWDAMFAMDALNEYRRFMYLKAINSKCVPSQTIEDVWKHHVMHTESYAELCGLLEGFIHYKPSENDTPMSHYYSVTTSLYQKELGITPSGGAWDGPGRVRKVLVDPNKVWIFKRLWGNK